MNIRSYFSILILGLLFFFVPLVWQSNELNNFLIYTIIIALGATGWNLLGGIAGQTSFGHAAFFGVGAYATSLWQINLGMGAWSGFFLAIGAGALVGWVIGYLSFRAGLRGSYFALVTLAFAEVLRVLSNSFSFTGGAAGKLLEIKLGFMNFQLESRLHFYWIVLFVMMVALLLVSWLVRSRFGAQLIAIRENEEAAKALGVDTFTRKLQAISLSGAITASAGALYVQYFLYIDPILVFGPKVSVEVLLATMVGGLGTVLGPLVGALALHTLGEVVKLFTGGVPGVDVAVYGAVLVIAVCFMPRGLLSLVERYQLRRQSIK